MQLLNGNERDPDKMKQLDSNPHVKKLLQNLTNTDLQSQEAVLEQQKHLVNFCN